jgi:hypothetical protein
MALNFSEGDKVVDFGLLVGLHLEHLRRSKEDVLMRNCSSGGDRFITCSCVCSSRNANVDVVMSNCKGVDDLCDERCKER